ncbi:DUF4259 domain-containing protein [Streptomyces coeruleorubidus]|uniref:DUF4259 domain-containing protein n=1 Tax=Streptomyces coeruleorubidus TaxID=116188 RepID=UPI0033A53C0B
MRDGTWGTGPFDSDLAADFVDGLEGLASQQVINVLEQAFQRVANAGTRVEGGDGVEAVAAAALVASTIANSQIMIDPEDGPGHGTSDRRAVPADRPLAAWHDRCLSAGWHCSCHHTNAMPRDEAGLAALWHEERNTERFPTCLLSTAVEDAGGARM